MRQAFFSFFLFFFFTETANNMLILPGKPNLIQVGIFPPEIREYPNNLSLKSIEIACYLLYIDSN